MKSRKDGCKQPLRNKCSKWALLAIWLQSLWRLKKTQCYSLFLKVLKSLSSLEWKFNQWETVSPFISLPSGMSSLCDTNLWRRMAPEQLSLLPSLPPNSRGYLAPFLTEAGTHCRPLEELLFELQCEHSPAKSKHRPYVSLSVTGSSLVLRTSSRRGLLCLSPRLTF